MDKIYIEKIDSTNWSEIQGYSSKGRRVKCWLERLSDNKVFIYKEPKEFFENSPKAYMSQEIWSEFLAYKIGAYIGLNVPRAIPAVYEIKKPYTYGVLIESFVDENIKLIEAKELSKLSISHTIEDIKKFMRGVPKDWEAYRKMLIFDCLIGNNDRHDENWGFCVLMNKQSIRMSPIYDNASCLSREMNDDKVLEVLNSETKFEKYITGKKSKPPNLFLTRNHKLENKHSNHFEIMQYLLETEKDMKDLIINLLEKDYLSYIDDIIKNIKTINLPTKYQISDNRHKLILKILEYRRNKLKELV